MFVISVTGLGMFNTENNYGVGDSSDGVVVVMIVVVFVVMVLVIVMVML